MNSLKSKFLIPLHYFNWDGDKIQLADLCAIEKLDSPPDLSSNEFLSNIEIEELSHASHWLSFEQSSSDDLSSTEKINIFLLALWIIQPTIVQVCFKFEFQCEHDNINLISPHRLLERFQWIRQQAGDEITSNHLVKIQEIINPLKSIYLSRKRLWNSIVLTYNGCSTIHWQVAFICFSAAVEGMLTYDRGGGITKRLAKSYACLISDKKEQRDFAFHNFFNSYDIRSDIMHGRIVFSKKQGSDNINELTKLSNLLRELWERILLSKSYITELEKDDAGRKVFFSDIENCYNPPN